MEKHTKQPQKTSGQRRAAARLRLFLVLIVLDIALIVGTVLMLPTAFQKTDRTTGETMEWLGVKTITVKGNTRYDDEAIIDISGIRVGQSIFSVNKRKAVENIRETFAYTEAVTVEVGLSRHVVITVTETQELGAVYLAGDPVKKKKGRWMVVGRDGRGLMELPVESERPFRRVYLKGADTVGETVGGAVLSENDLRDILKIYDAMAENGLVGVGEIDLSDRANIRLNWKNQITINLGNNSNLEYEIKVAVRSIPKVLSRHGETATGLLNLSQYSDSSITTPHIVFTPSSILDAENEAKPEENPPADGDEKPETTTTTAKPR